MRPFACTLLLALAIQPFRLPAQPPATEAPAPLPLRALYAWGYSGMEGSGKGSLSILIEPTTGHVILELYGLGERLVFVNGDKAAGYHVQIPRRELDLQKVPFSELPLPFLPQLGQVENLYKLLTEGTGPGVKVTKRDGKGPVKLRYSGTDERGKDVMVWLQRTRWEPAMTSQN